MDHKLTEPARVLVVDDQDNWREFLCEMLGNGYEIETAASYTTAADKLKRCAFDVMVADQRLKDSDPGNVEGVELMRYARDLRDGMQTIIVTGYPDIEAVKRAFRDLDAFDYLLKHPADNAPFNTRKYRELVADAVKLAREERTRATTVRFDPAILADELSYDALAATALGAGGEVGPNDVNDARMAFLRVLTPLQPILPGVCAYDSNGEARTARLACWSRGVGAAALVVVTNAQDTAPSFGDSRVREIASASIGQVRAASYLVDGTEPEMVDTLTTLR